MTRTKRPTTTAPPSARRSPWWAPRQPLCARSCRPRPRRAPGSPRPTSPPSPRRRSRRSSAGRPPASVVDYADLPRSALARPPRSTAAGMGLPTAALRDAWAVGAASTSSTRCWRRCRSSACRTARCGPRRARGSTAPGSCCTPTREAGIELPRSSGDQIREADEIGGFEAEPGDLVYYPGHISMYVGAGLMVHSPYSGSEVEVRQIFDRSVRFGDVFDGSVAYVEPAPSLSAPCGRPRSAPARPDRRRWRPYWWIGPLPSRSDGVTRPGAAGDDLGADRDRRLLGRAGADVEPDR